MAVPPTEDIVRAVCTDKWDGERLSPSLFISDGASDTRPDGGVSVSRLAITPLDDHWDLFREHVQKPPQRLLAMIAQINVGELQKIGRAYPPPVELTVEPWPQPWPAHAQIPQRIARGLANRILPALKLHRPPPA